MKDFTSDTVLLKGSREHNSESPNSNIGSNLLQFIAELRQLPGPCDILCSYTDFLYEIEGLAEKNNGYDITLVVIRAPNEDFCKGNRKVVWKEDDKALLSFVTEDNANTERSEDKASEPSIARIEGYFTGLMKINSHSVERIVSFFERTSTKQLKLLEFFKLLIETKEVKVNVLEFPRERFHFFREMKDLHWAKENREEAYERHSYAPSNISKTRNGPSLNHKTVIVTQRLLETKEYVEDREALDTRWGAFFKKLNVLPVPTLTDTPVDFYFKLIQPSGIVLSGGNNIEKYEGDKLSGKRDAFERSLIAEALVKQVPIYGICRGTQLVADMIGLKLVKKPGHVAKKHEIKIHQDSRFFERLSMFKSVNSYHGYCIDSQHNSFYIDDFEVKITARCVEDETVEAFEIPRFNILCVMWHPERVEDFDPVDIDIISELFNLS